MMQRASPAFHRRLKYSARLYNDDYFMLKRLEQFVSNRLNNLVRGGCLVGDIGCGEQPFRKQIEALGGIYIGIDAVQNSQNTVEIIARLPNVPLADSCLDVIVCTEVLEHVSDTQGAFRELSRLVRTGGYIIITTPFSYPLHEEPYDFVRLTPYQFWECARQNGLKVMELTTSGNELEVMATLCSKMWDIGRAHRSFIGRAWLGGIRLVMNALVVVGEIFFKSWLPQKHYLSTLCVLTK